jgi:amidase
VEGVVTQSIRDTAAILDAISGPMPGDPIVAPPPVRPFRGEVGADPGRLRIALMTRAPGNAFDVHPECAASAERAARVLGDLGHAIEVAHPPALDDPELGRHFTILYATHGAHTQALLGLLLGRPLAADDVDPLNWILAEMGRGTTALEYLATEEWMHRFMRRMEEWFTSGFDLLLTPTLPEPPPPLGTLRPTLENALEVGERAARLAGFTSPFNLSGEPAISLPLAWSTEGLPIGVQLAAPWGREDLLIRVASQLEEALPWRERIPPVATSLPGAPSVEPQRG